MRGGTPYEKGVDVDPNLAKKGLLPFQLHTHYSFKHLCLLDYVSGIDYAGHGDIYTIRMALPEHSDLIRKKLKNLSSDNTLQQLTFMRVQFLLALTEEIFMY